jgi:4-amino-4-deoxy-L-arabinose transferase-like glycosyltransferase
MDQTLASPRRPVTLADRAVAIVTYFEATHRRAMALMLAVCLAAFLPGFWTTGPIDREEARTAQMTKQMLETGDFAVPDYLGNPVVRAPPGLHWLQAGAVKAGEALGVSRAQSRIALYRLPSLAGAIAAVMLVYWAALAFLSRRGALIAANMLAVSLLLGVEARLAKGDPILLAATVAVMGALARVWLAARAEEATRVSFAVAMVFWLALAVGTMVKGSAILIIVVLTVIALIAVAGSVRWLSGLRVLPGLALFLVIVAPWFVGRFLVGDVESMASALGLDRFVPTVLGSGGGSPPGLYYIISWATFWPAAPLFALAAPAMWAARREPATIFLMAWLFPSWLLFEFMLSKSAQAVLPLFPAIAILTARAMEAGTMALEDRRWRWVMLMWPVFALAIAVLLLAALIGVQGRPGLLAWPVFGASVFFALVAFRFLRQDGPERSYYHAAFASLFLTLGAYAVVIPSMRAAFPSPTIAAAIRTVDCPAPKIAATGYVEPSLKFLVGTDVAFMAAGEAGSFIADGGCRVAIVEARHERNFAQRAEGEGALYRRIARVDGFNYNGGRWVSISVYRAEGPERAP